MADSTNILLPTGTAWHTGKAPMIDPLFGGTFGWSADPAEWMASQAHIPRNLIPIVLEVPGFLKHMPDANKWTMGAKLFWEKQARKISGLKKGLSAEIASHAFGGDGRQFHEFTDVKRDVSSTISVELTDRRGRVWQNFFDAFMRYGMMDPETKTPMIATLAGVNTDDLAPNWFSWTIAFIQPEEFGKRCVDCWICANVWPHGTGAIDGEMDKTSARSISELSLDFTSLDFVNNGTRSVGQTLMDNIQMVGANPQLREGFLKEIHPDVLAVTKGYQESVESIAKSK